MHAAIVDTCRGETIQAGHTTQWTVFVDIIGDARCSDTSESPSNALLDKIYINIFGTSVLFLAHTTDPACSAYLCTLWVKEARAGGTKEARGGGHSQHRTRAQRGGALRVILFPFYTRLRISAGKNNKGTRSRQRPLEMELLRVQSTVRPHGIELSCECFPRSDGYNTIAHNRELGARSSLAAATPSSPYLRQEMRMLSSFATF